MDMTTVYIWGSIGAAFCLFVGALIGHCRKEKQHAEYNSASRDAIESERGSWRNMLQAERDTVRELEISLLNAGQALEVENMAVFELEMQLADAYDPKQNQKAKNLYVKGVRAGAKKGRGQMSKLYEKRFDAMQLTNQNLLDALASAHAREDIYREAVKVTLTDKVGLVGVRRAIVQGIAAECTRLRTVEVKKGE